MPIKMKCYRNHAVREPPTDRLSITYLKAVLVTSRKVAVFCVECEQTRKPKHLWRDKTTNVCERIKDDSVKRKKTR